MDIKQRLRLALKEPAFETVVGVSVVELCRDALAQIERLEQIPPHVVYPQHGQLLERIARALESIAQKHGEG